MNIHCFVLLGVATVSAATPSLTPPVVEKFNDTWTLKDKQLMVMKLLNRILQGIPYKYIEDIAMSYKLEENIELYIKTDVVKRFVMNSKKGHLPKGEIFCLYCEKQMSEVMDMFHVLYYAKDFDTFFKTASWMRLNLNEGMFIYALSVAVRHREDCKEIFLPAPYEIYPFYFVRADVIQKAYMLKMKRGLLEPKLAQFYGIKDTGKNTYVIDENIYDDRISLNTEDRMRYFTEDIDLNTYYYYFHVDFPFWMKDSIYDVTKARRGELSYYVHQQLLARYYLERLSNNLCEVRPLSYYKPVVTGYWPWLQHHNGIEMPVRYNNYVIARDENIHTLRLVEDYELLIREAIIKGYIDLPDGIRVDLKKPDDIELLGRLAYGKVDKYHGDFYRYLVVLIKSLLGLDTITSDKYFTVPSVLDQYQTALRDPVFWQLQKRLVDFFVLFKKRLPSYTHEDLYFPGVKIENVVIDKLVTFFDDSYLDITNAVLMDEVELRTQPEMNFLVRKRRLNHQRFKITLDIVSDKAIDSVIRIFLGPREDCNDRILDINENRLNFVELDTFIYKLKTNKNSIVRKCNDMHNLVLDRVMTSDLQLMLESMGADTSELIFKDLKNIQTGFPLRLLLPKGRLGGMKMMLYVIVSPVRMFSNLDNSVMSNVGNMFDYRTSTMMDRNALGFPLDRHIEASSFFTPNMKFVEVTVFHQSTVCDMKTRWESYVLQSYNIERMSSMKNH